MFREGRVLTQPVALERIEALKVVRYDNYRVALSAAAARIEDLLQQDDVGREAVRGWVSLRKDRVGTNDVLDGLEAGLELGPEQLGRDGRHGSGSDETMLVIKGSWVGTRAEVGQVMGGVARVKAKEVENDEQADQIRQSTSSLRSTLHSRPYGSQDGTLYQTVRTAISILPDPLLVRLPALGAVPLGLPLPLLPALSAVDAPSDDDDVAAVLSNDLLRRPVLLSERVARLCESDSRGQDEEVDLLLASGQKRRELVCGEQLLDARLGDEADDKVWSASGHADGLLGVLSRREHAGAAHLGEEDEGPSERETDRGEAGDNARPRQGVGVGHVCPGSNLVVSRRVLKRDGVA